MAQPTDAPARHAGGKMAEQAGDRTTPVDADNEIAQRIRTRYGDSPGVLQMDATLGLARRISRWSTGRLPLLAEIQRRWAPRGHTTSGGLSYLQGALALPYARPAAVSVTQLIPETMPRNAAAPRPVPTPMGRLGLQRAALAPSPAAASAPPMPVVEAGWVHVAQAAARGSDPGSTSQQRHRSGPGDRVVQRQEISSGPARTREASATGASSPTSVPSPARSVASTGQGARKTEGLGIQRAAEARTTSRTAPSASDLGAVILQRHLSGPAERAIQQPGAWPAPRHLAGRAAARPLPQARSQLATVSLARAGPLTVARSSAHVDPVAPAGQGTLPPGGGRALQLAGAQVVPRATSSSGDPRMAIQSQRLSDPGGQPVQRQPAGLRPRAGQRQQTPPEPVPRHDRAAVEALLGEAASQPASGGAQPATGPQMAPATVTTAGDLGASILQRHLGGPAGRAIRHESSPPAVAYTTLGLSLRSFAPGRAKPTNLPTVQLARQALKTAPVAGQPPAVASGNDRQDSQALGMAQNVQAVASGGGTPPTATPGPASMPLSRAAGSVAGPGIVRRLAMPLSPSTQPTMEVSETAPGPAGQPYPVTQELPLFRAVERRVAGPEGESARPPSSPPGQSGARLTHWLQRAPAESTPATPAAATSTVAPVAPAAGPSPGAPAGGPMPGLEGPDVERLADQVYTIIERRLIIERESLGL